MARKRWTAEDDARLTALYVDHSARECAEMLGCSHGAVTARVDVLGLKKTPGWIAERTRQRWAEGRHANSRKGHFQKGHETWNKGVPASTGLHPNCRRTQFKKGNMAGAAQAKYVPIGSLRVTQNQLQQKVTDDPSIYPARRWVPVARLVWEAEHGPIPPAHVVRFKSGMHTLERDLITTDRLECVSRVENMRRNSYWHNLPRDVAELVQLRGQLSRAINRKQKGASPTRTA